MSFTVSFAAKGPPMHLSLDKQSKTIALEAMGGESSLKAALTRLPNFLKDVSTRFGKAVATPIDALFHRKDLKWAAEHLQAFDYADVRTRKVPVVPGLNTDYLTYVEELDGAAQVAKGVLERFVVPLTDFIAKRLANPDLLRSHAPDPAIAELNEKSLKEIAGWIKDLNSQVDSTPVHSELPYGKAVKRNADWEAIIGHAESIHDAFAKDDQTRFKKAVERLNELLGTLLGRVSHESDAYAVAGPTLTRISEAVYVTATFVEFYGLIYRRAVVLDHSLDELVNTVKTFH